MKKTSFHSGLLGVIGQQVRSVACLSSMFFLATCFVNESPAKAGAFEALCDGDVKCMVILSDQSISVGSVTIEPSKIISWGETEAKSKRKPELCLLSLTACALTIFHDYRYHVNYADSNGEIIKIGFRFINDKPAKQLVRDLTQLTNLASGQTNNTAKSWAENRQKEVEYQKMVDSLNCSPVLKPYGCSYNAYLDANPAVQTWAEANPGLVNSQIIRMNAVESLPSKQ